MQGPDELEPDADELDVEADVECDVDDEPGLPLDDVELAEVEDPPGDPDWDVDPPLDCEPEAPPVPLPVESEFEPEKPGPPLSDPLHAVTNEHAARLTMAKRRRMGRLSLEKRTIGRDGRRFSAPSIVRTIVGRFDRVAFFR